ncbi:MAG: polyamine aminopropyltransferase, partial [Bacteroidota bacterium]
LFATGLSGIVAEYVLATLASYFLGNSVIQWTLIISLMLFFMGLGSRLTRRMSGNLFQAFIVIEFVLSLLVAFSALTTYSVAAFSDYIGLYIYTLAVLTGLLIGMEIPLAIRLNEQFEELKVNVSGILEKDYYGSLLGGLFFAFIGLPYLGLTYTPFILGLINLSVAIALLNFFPIQQRFKGKAKLNLTALTLAIAIFAGLWNAQQIIFYGEQKRYSDKIVHSEQSKYQKIVMTEWQGDHWLYLDNNLQFSSFDEVMYHEVLVHPAVQLGEQVQRALVLGGGDGCAVRELLKYAEVEQITLVDLDPAITRLAMENEILLKVNQRSLHDQRVRVVNADGFQFLENQKDFYDVIVIDLPDPRNVELSRLYSLEFYQLAWQRLRAHGVLITQAGSPYFSPKSFHCIEKTMAKAGFSTLPLHNQIITMGEWGWILGTKAALTREALKERLLQIDLKAIETAWLNTEAMALISSFGKAFFMPEQTDTLRVNRIHDPVLQGYYLNGKWTLY